MAQRDRQVRRFGQSSTNQWRNPQQLKKYKGLTGVMERVITGTQTYEGDKVALKPVLMDFINQAQQSVRVVSGELPAEFYTDADVLAMLQAIIDQKSGPVQFIASPRAQQYNPQSIKALKGIGATVYQRDFRRRGHFAVLDNRHIALEDPHDAQDPIRVWRIAYHSPVAQQLVREFSNLKTGAKAL